MLLQLQLVIIGTGITVGVVQLCSSVHNRAFVCCEHFFLLCPSPETKGPSCVSSPNYSVSACSSVRRSPHAGLV